MTPCFSGTCTDTHAGAALLFHGNLAMAVHLISACDVGLQRRLAASEARVSSLQRDKASLEAQLAELNRDFTCLVDRWGLGGGEGAARLSCIHLHQSGSCPLQASTSGIERDIV
jgi:hypothetical protein